MSQCTGKPSQPPGGSNDCYSSGERTWMEAGQRMRARAFQPLVKALTFLQISPDNITLVSALVGLSFVPLWLFDCAGLAFLCLAVHVLLDGLDGPLARFQGVDCPRGSFTDSFIDQLVVTGVTVGWMVEQGTPMAILLGGAFVFLYALVIAMAMVRNALQVPYGWLLRPRFLVYLSLFSDWYLGTQWTNAVIAVCVVVLAWKTATGFYRLRRTLPGPG